MRGAGALLRALILLVLLSAVHGRADAEVIAASGESVLSPVGHWAARPVTDDWDGPSILAPPGREDDLSPLEGHPAEGFRRAPLWLRLDLRREPTATAEWVLEVGPPFMEQLEVAVVTDDGGVKRIQAGAALPFAARPIPHRGFAFPVVLPDTRPVRLYVRLPASGSAFQSVRIETSAVFAQRVAAENLRDGLVNGAVLVVILLALAQYLARRDGIYLDYLAYAVPLEIMHLCRGGFAAQFLLPDHPALAHGLTGAATLAALGGGMVFAVRLLDLPGHHPRLGRAMEWAGRAVQASVLAVPLGWYGSVFPLAAVPAVAAYAAALFAAAERTLAGNRTARLVLAALLAPLLFVAAAGARVLGAETVPLGLDVIASLAVALHLALPCFGLARRDVDREADRDRIRRARLESARRMERVLEEKVRRRTADLNSANAALAEREGQMRAILDAAPLPMVVSGYPEGTVLFMNGPACELFNVTADEAVGMAAEAFFVEPADRLELLRRLGEGGAVSGLELRARRLPRQQRWVMLSAVRFDWRERPCSLVCLNDISQRRQLEESLRLTGRRAVAALEAERRVVREQRNFLAMVSHEFRIPLSIIGAASQVLDVCAPTDAMMGEEVDKIRRAVRRMSDLMDVFLADERLNSTMMRIIPGPVDLVRLLSDLCDDKRPHAGDRVLTLEAPSTLGMVGDGPLLRIGFSNLIDNALKFSPVGSEIRVTVEDRLDAVRVSVADAGPGIALEEQGRIFEKFYRSTRSDRMQGAGLGLFIVHRIMDLHGAALALDSLPGRGAVFDVWLPRGLDDDTCSINT